MLSNHGAFGVLRRRFNDAFFFLIITYSAFIQQIFQNIFAQKNSTYQCANFLKDFTI